jgi:cell volume regulation protein A
MIDVISALVILGVIMILGFIGNFIFNRTQIPSIIWLLLFGLIVGFIFNIRGEFDQQLLFTISEFFAAIAIVIILFDGGINTDLYQLFKGAPRGFLLTVSGFCFSLIATMTIIIGLAAVNILPITLEDSLLVGALLGVIIGGTSSPIVIPLASRLKNLQDKTKMVLSIESIITDPLAIVIVLAGVYMIVIEGSANIGLGIKNLVSTFSVGIVVGAILGFIWLPIMHRVRKEQYSYVLTLAVVFLVYSLTALLIGVEEGGTGAGAISCLMFGLVLGNGKKILKMIRYEGKGYEMDDATKQFHGLTSFIIRTFFFVYLGIMVNFKNLDFIIVGIIVLLAVLALRYLAVIITTYNGGFEKDDKQTMAIMMPRGLAAAILAINFGPLLVGEKGLNLGQNMIGFFEDVTFVVIFGTAIITTVGISFISHYEMKKINNNVKNKNIEENKVEKLEK